MTLKECQPKFMITTPLTLKGGQGIFGKSIKKFLGKRNSFGSKGLDLNGFRMVTVTRGTSMV